jgi:hypothetical protein
MAFMRTFVTISVIVFFAINNLYSQLPEERLKEMVQHNNIKSLTQWNHKYSDGKPEKEGYKNTYKEFDKFGNVIKEIYYRSGDINQKLSYKYDQNQNKTEYINYSAKKDQISFKQTIEYDDEGKKIMEERYNGSEHFKIDYRYNDNDELTEIIKKKQITSGASVSYELDERRVFSREGNTTTIEVLDDSGTLLSKIVNKYDNRGNLIEFNEYEPNGDRVKQISYKFNDQNLKVQEVKYQQGNFIYKKDFHYDKDGNLTEIQQEEPKDQMHISKIYEYNPENKLAKEMWYDSMAEKYSHKKFTYNSNGVLQEVEVFYALYNYKVMYKFKYEFY